MEEELLLHFYSFSHFELSIEDWHFTFRVLSDQLKNLQLAVFNVYYYCLSIIKLFSIPAFCFGKERSYILAYAF